MRELVAVLRPVMRPELMYRVGARVLRVEDPYSGVSTRRMNSVITSGIRYTINSALNHTNSFNIISRGSHTDREFCWVPRQNFTCEYCHEPQDDYPGLEAKYHPWCRGIASHPRRLPMKECPGCHEMYQPNDSRQKHCSVACALKYRPYHRKTA